MRNNAVVVSAPPGSRTSAAWTTAARGENSIAVRNAGPLMRRAIAKERTAAPTMPT